MADPLASFDRAKQQFMRDMRAAMSAACDAGAKLLLDEMKLLSARIDHDLNELRRMGHPYRKDDPPGFPHPDWIVHIQNGDLQAGLKRLPPEVNTLSVTTDILSQARHTWYLLLGTKKMRPRDFVTAALRLRAAEVDQIFQRAFFAVIEGTRTPGRAVTIREIEHTQYPAQLPEVFF